MQQTIEMTFHPSCLSDDDLAAIGGSFATVATSPIDDVLVYLAGALAGFVLKPEQERRAAGGEPRARILRLTDTNLRDDEVLQVLAFAMKTRADYLELGNIEAAQLMDAILCGFHDAYKEREAAVQVEYLENLIKVPYNRVN